MDEASFKIQVRHLKSCIAGLRLFDLAELQACAAAHGTAADRDLVAALVLALEVLPEERH